jgi:hypothetical protein
MKQILLIVTFIIALTSCSNNDDGFIPTLPEVTQSGKNTFGCFVDGKLLTPRDGTGLQGIPDKGIVYWGSTNSIYNEIDVHDFKSENGDLLTLHIQNLDQNGSGNFIINESNCEKLNNANPSINMRLRFDNIWYCSIEDTGSLVISRYDFENRIVSGTFNFSAQNRDNPNEIIEVTEGRFDLKWDELPFTQFP